MKLKKYLMKTKKYLKKQKKRLIVMAIVSIVLGVAVALIETVVHHKGVESFVVTAGSIFLLLFGWSNVTLIILHRLKRVTNKQLMEHFNLIEKEVESITLRGKVRVLPRKTFMQVGSPLYDYYAELKNDKIRIELKPVIGEPYVIMKFDSFDKFSKYFMVVS